MDDTILKFLLGEEPLDGVWFGDTHPTERGMFWWRKHLRQYLEQAQLQQHNVVRESPPVKEEIDLYLKGQRDTIKLIFDYILGLDEPLVGGGQAQNVSEGLPKRKSFKERLAEEMDKAKIGQPRG